MKKIRKILVIILLFAVMYCGVMIVAIDYLYEYPIGFLDELEREDGALSYKLTYKEKIDSNTTLYFTRSSNGTGSTCHIGTVDSSLPDIMANLSCESTSSFYFAIDSFGYLETDNSEYNILFGATTDENTVSVTIFFYDEENDTYITYDMDVLTYDYDNAYFFYTTDVDSSVIGYSCYIEGYNSEDGITFSYSGDGLANQTVVSKS